jgi:hypothetical protein
VDCPNRESHRAWENGFAGTSSPRPARSHQAKLTLAPSGLLDIFGHVISRRLTGALLLSNSFQEKKGPVSMLSTAFCCVVSELEKSPQPD